MQLSDIANIRLYSQHILQPHHNTVKDVFGFMGALQAQDYSMMKWAVGTRLPKVKEHTVEASINKGEIIRTHLLRPTWHLVSADDIYWMCGAHGSTHQENTTCSRSQLRTHQHDL